MYTYNYIYNTNFNDIRFGIECAFDLWAAMASSRFILWHWCGQHSLQWFRRHQQIAGKSAGSWYKLAAKPSSSSMMEPFGSIWNLPNLTKEYCPAKMQCSTCEGRRCLQWCWPSGLPQHSRKFRWPWRTDGIKSNIATKVLNDICHFSTVILWQFGHHFCMSILQTRMLKTYK